MTLLLKRDASTFQDEADASYQYCVTPNKKSFANLIFASIILWN